MRTLSPIIVLAILLAVPFASAADPTYVKVSNPATLPSSLGLLVSWDGSEKYLAESVCSSPYFLVYYVDGGVFTKLADPATLPTACSEGLAMNHAGTLVAVGMDASPWLMVYALTGSGASTTLTRIAGANIDVPPTVNVHGMSWSPTDDALTITTSVSGGIKFATYAVAGSGTSTTFTKMASPATMPCACDMWSAEFSPDGTRIVVGGQTEARVYTRSGTTITYEATPYSGAAQGSCAAWTRDNLTVCLTLYAAPKIQCYSRSGTTWSSATSPTPPFSGGVDCGAFDSTGTYYTVTGQQTPFFKTFKKTGSGAGISWTTLSDPSTLPGSTVGAANCVKWSGYNTYVAMSQGSSPFIFIYSTGIGNPPVGGNFNITLLPLTSSEMHASWPRQNGATSYVVYVNMTSGFTVGANSYALNTTSTVAVVNGLADNTTYCFKTRANDAGFDSNESCARTFVSGISVNFTGNFTRVVPDTVNITINRSTVDDMIVACARVDPSGAIRSACTPSLWPRTNASSYQFAYPQSVRSSTQSTDAASYILYVTTTSSFWYGYQTFCIQTSWSGTCYLPIGTDAQVQLASDAVNGYTAAVQAKASAQAIVSEVSVRQHYLDALDWGLAPFAPCNDTTVAGAADEPGCKVPNIGWWYLGTLIMVGVGISRRTRP